MLTGIIPATEKLLARSGLSLGEIDRFEVNEAFASRGAGLGGDAGARTSIA